MRAAVLHALGQAPRFEDFAEPTADDGETVVKVLASAIKQLDRGIVAGRHYSSPKPDQLPIVPGQDGIGRLADGSRGYFFANRRPFGAWAERAPTRWTAPVPDALDDATAAAIVNSALAGFLPLVWRAGLKPGETVLVLGATGAAGGMAVTAARLLGAGRVIGAGRNQAALDSLALDERIDLRIEGDALVWAFRALGRVDVVVDYLWGPVLEALLTALTSHHTDAVDAGEVRLVTLGELAGATVAMPSAVFRSNRLTLLGSGTGNLPQPDRLTALIGEIFAHTVAGRLSIATEPMPLARVEAVWPTLAGRERRVVLVP